MIFTTLGSTGKNLVLILLERRRKYGRQCDASTLGPSIVALCLRAGWKLGGVTEMYHFRQDTGDLNVVRRAPCLDIETKYYGYRRHISTVRTWTKMASLRQWQWPKLTAG